MNAYICAKFLIATIVNANAEMLNFAIVEGIDKDRRSALPDLSGDFVVDEACFCI